MRVAGTPPEDCQLMPPYFPELSKPFWEPGAVYFVNIHPIHSTKTKGIKRKGKEREKTYHHVNPK